MIISFHALPMDVIASQRTQAYLDYFSQNDVFPTLVTHRWEKSGSSKEWAIHHESDKVKYEKFSGYDSYQLPFPGFDKKDRFSFLNTIVSWSRGILEPHLKKSYSIYRKFLFEHLKTNDYDLVLAIFSPHFHLKLAYEIKVRFNIPYVLDFRDLWSNRIIHKDYSPSLSEWFQDKLTSYWWRKWLEKALFFSITSSPWLMAVQKNTNTSTPGIVVTNGFDQEVEKLANSLYNRSKFTLIHSGSVYHHQNLNIFFKGVVEFIEEFDVRDIQILFIGAQRKEGNALNGFATIEDEYANLLQAKGVLHITPRITRQEILKKMSEAFLLIFPSFPRAPGTYSGKFFEYLGLRKFILAFPNDHSVVNEVLISDKNSIIADNEEEIKLALREFYKKWEASESPALVSSHDFFSRKNQVQIISKQIHLRLQNE